MAKSKAEYWKTASSKPGFKERRNALQKERYKRHSELLARIKDVPCADCGGRFHHCQMEFDHKPGEDKVLSIGRMKKNSWPTILAEIEKCDIVCANCHALRTWKRWQ